MPRSRTEDDTLPGQAGRQRKCLSRLQVRTIAYRGESSNKLPFKKVTEGVGGKARQAEMWRAQIRCSVMVILVVVIVIGIAVLVNLAPHLTRKRKNIEYKHE